MGRATKKQAVQRLTRDDWAQAALAALADGGVSAVSVEPIARALGVTKGSFYWHFRNREDLLEATLQRWEQRGTQALFDEVGGVTDPRERLHRMMVAAFDPRNHGRLLIFLAAARDEPLVEPFLRRVTQRRLDFIAQCYIECGMNETDAERHALLSYSAYVGMSQVMASMPERVPSGEALQAYVEHVANVLIP